MKSEVTVGEHAQIWAADMSRFERTVLGTGRVLVKSLYEHMGMPESNDPSEFAQYSAPELRALGKLYVGAIAYILRLMKADNYAPARMLATNRDARLGLQSIVKYDSNGRID